MKYTKIINLLTKVFEELPKEIDLSKGGLGELALANHLGHKLVAGDKGADAEDKDGKLYEYKVSTTDQYNFHFGARKEGYELVIAKHFEGLKGAYCANREGIDIVNVAFVPTHLLVPALLKHFEKTKGKQLNKNFSLKSFENLNNNHTRTNNEK